MPVLAVCIAWIGGACGPAPSSITDEDEAAVLAEALRSARATLAIPDSTPVHPYLAVANDSTGTPRLDLSLFEYEPSAALRLLQQSGGVALCHVSEQGHCEGGYVVISRITRTGDRDALIVIQHVRSRTSASHAVVRLRYNGARWVIAAVERVSFRLRQELLPRIVSHTMAQSVHPGTFPNLSEIS